ncbi:MAG: hypothetical protein RR557_08110, partial [Bacilli bacterium]
GMTTFVAILSMETAGVEPQSPRNALTAVFIRVLYYFRNCLTTFEKNYVAGQGVSIKFKQLRRHNKHIDSSSSGSKKTT